jgi:hypothetical protein
VTTESIAASSNESKARKDAEPETVLYQTGTGRAPTTKSAFSLEALGATILENLKLLLIGPVIAGIVAFGSASFLPKWYTSAVYLRIDETVARTADALMRSTPVLDKILGDLKTPQDMIESRRRDFDENRRIVVAPGEIQKTSNLFRMEYSDGDPQVAQKVNSLFLDAWLASTKPPPDRMRAIEAEIERRELLTKSITQLIDRLQKDAPSLVAQSLQGELATPIAKLIETRDENLGKIIFLKDSLNGVSRDVVFGAPSLPESPSWPRKRMIALLAGFVTGLLLLMFVIVRRFRSA